MTCEENRDQGGKDRRTSPAGGRLFHGRFTVCWKQGAKLMTSCRGDGDELSGVCIHRTIMLGVDRCLYQLIDAIDVLSIDELVTGGRFLSCGCGHEPRAGWFDKGCGSATAWRWIGKGLDA